MTLYKYFVNSNKNFIRQEGNYINKNKYNIIITFIIILVFFIYDRIKKKSEHFNLSKKKSEREMYIPNCNFLTDTNICENTKGCQVINDKCYYDWSNLD
jgi:hypothetical protein